MEDRGREEPYTLDSLVADQRRQTRFVLVILLLAVLYFAARSLFPGVPEGEPPREPPGSEAAPAETP